MQDIHLQALWLLPLTLTPPPTFLFMHSDTKEVLTVLHSITGCFPTAAVTPRLYRPRPPPLPTLSPPAAASPLPSLTCENIKTSSDCCGTLQPDPVCGLSCLRGQSVYIVPTVLYSSAVQECGHQGAAVWGSHGFTFWFEDKLWVFCCFCFWRFRQDSWVTAEGVGMPGLNKVTPVFSFFLFFSCIKFRLSVCFQELATLTTFWEVFENRH